MPLLNDRLSEMYQTHYNELISNLERVNLKDQVQPPFQLGLLRHNEGNLLKGDESWYTNANLKVMIFGREAHIWDWPQLPPNAQVNSDDLVEAYEQFYSCNYRDNLFLTDTAYKLDKVQFFRTGFNGFIDGIIQRLNKEYTDKRAAFLWNNISKLSTRKGRISRKVTALIHQYELRYYHVIPLEISLLQPDIVIFFTGFREPYDRYIQENFCVDFVTGIGNISINDVVKLKLSEVPLAYKTHHLLTTLVGGRSLNDTMRWEHYNAILDDIAKNFHKIKGLE